MAKSKGQPVRGKRRYQEYWVEINLTELWKPEEGEALQLSRAERGKISTTASRVRQVDRLQIVDTGRALILRVRITVPKRFRSDVHGFSERVVQDVLKALSGIRHMWAREVLDEAFATKF